AGAWRSPSARTNGSSPCCSFLHSAALQRSRARCTKKAPKAAQNAKPRSRSDAAVSNPRPGVKADRPSATVASSIAGAKATEKRSEPVCAGQTVVDREEGEV